MNAPVSLERAEAPSLSMFNLRSIHSRDKAAWAGADYAAIGTTFQIVSELLCEAADLKAGETVLDVATSNGNASLSAARRFARVTSTDYVAAFLENGLLRAAADRLPVTFRTATCEHLPFRDASFDVVMSAFGVMFSTDHESAAREMVRVARPGGRIALANLAPDSLIALISRKVCDYAPLAEGLISSELWGTADGLVQLFGLSISALTVQHREFNFRYRSAEHWLDFFKTYYGPLKEAFGILSPDENSALEGELIDLLRRFNRGPANTLVASSAYVEVVVTKSLGS